MLMSKYPKLTFELLTSSRKNALEKYKKNASFLYGFFGSLLSTICEVSYYRKILMYFSQKGSLCLQMSVWKQMWVKVDLLSFFSKCQTRCSSKAFLEIHCQIFWEVATLANKERDQKSRSRTVIWSKSVNLSSFSKRCKSFCKCANQLQLHRTTLWFMGSCIKTWTFHVLLGHSLRENGRTYYLFLYRETRTFKG